MLAAFKAIPLKHVFKMRLHVGAPSYFTATLPSNRKA